MRIASILALKPVTEEQITNLLDFMSVPILLGDGTANPFYTEVVHAAVAMNPATLIPTSVVRDLLFNGSPAKFTIRPNADGWFPLWSLYIGDNPHWDKIRGVLFEFYVDQITGRVCTVPADDKDAVRWLRGVWRGLQRGEQ